jgi:hypothetical protein
MLRRDPAVALSPYNKKWAGAKPALPPFDPRTAITP